MRFGRVDGHLTWESIEGRDCLRLVVVLETSGRLIVVRDHFVEPETDEDGEFSLAWLADQFTQETIAVDLANQGWEVVSGSQSPAAVAGEIARSATYTVRRLTT